MHGYEHSIDLCLPPLGVLVLRRDEVRSVLNDAREDSGI
jgi:1,4-alpha-glucan branching enzyme